MAVIGTATPEAQLREEDGLAVRWLRDAGLADGDPFARRSHDLDHAQLAQRGQDAVRFIAQSGQLAERRQCLSEHVGQKANQDVNENPVCSLVPDGADFQVIFLNPEGRLGLGQLHIGFPQFLVTVSQPGDDPLPRALFDAVNDKNFALEVGKSAIRYCKRDK